jgi:hypothetical protein
LRGTMRRQQSPRLPALTHRSVNKEVFIVGQALTVRCSNRP